MIKKFKIFERFNNVDFNVGDFVYAIDIEGTNFTLKYDTKYKIVEIFKNIIFNKNIEHSNNPEDFCFVVEGDSELPVRHSYTLGKFISEKQYLEELKTKKTANKYNL